MNSCSTNADQAVRADRTVGFDAKALRKIVSLRKKSQTDRQEEEAILAVYMHALGMSDEAPEQPEREVMDAAE